MSTPAWHEPVLQQFPAVRWDGAARALIVPPELARAVAEWLTQPDHGAWDFCSNVTGVDYLPREVKEKSKRPDGTEEIVVRTEPGSLQVVYHLYSVAQRSGPLVLKQVVPRQAPAAVSLTPVWRSCELQEREVYDLFGVSFEGHPDLRRILMWDEFTGHPMRKDYAEPQDYEWEPTPHGDVLEKHRRGKVIIA